MAKTKVVKFINGKARIYSSIDLESLLQEVGSDGAFINPNLNAVKGIPPELWALEDGKIVPIKDAAEIQSRKEYKAPIKVSVPKPVVVPIVVEESKPAMKEPESVITTIFNGTWDSCITPDIDLSEIEGSIILLKSKSHKAENDIQAIESFQGLLDADIKDLLESLDKVKASNLVENQQLFSQINKLDGIIANQHFKHIQEFGEIENKLKLLKKTDADLILANSATEELANATLRKASYDYKENNERSLKIESSVEKLEAAFNKKMKIMTIILCVVALVAIFK